MRASIGRAMHVAIAGCLFATPILAQREAHLGCAYPAGGQRGTTVELTVAGQSLGGVHGVHVSGTGVQAELLAYDRPLTQKELNDLREQAAELTRRRDAASRRGSGNAPAWTPADAKLLAEIRTRLAERARRDLTPALAETATVRVVIAADAEPGLRDLRLLTPAGMTNPLRFCIGELPETRQAESREAGRRRDAAVATRVELPALVNGRIRPGEVDQVRFAAKRGQRLVATVAARSLLPYLADAVPGWFQAIVTLRDAQGRELACVDDYRFDPDPVLYHEVLVDGDYVLEVRDALYRGRDDFVYRLAIGELPFLTGIFPLGARAGAPAQVTLTGFNLPAAAVQLDGTAPCSVQVQAGGWHSNALPFARDDLDECGEREPNDAAAAAQPLAIGSIVNGRIDRRGDVDVFRFDGRAGQRVVADVMARRLGSPLDSILRLTDAGGHLLAVADDREDAADGLSTHHADALLQAALPADGTYFLHVGDAQAHGGDEFAYRLRLSPPRGDFQLRAVPSCINVRPGATVAFTVHVQREEGFDGDVALLLRDGPEGASLGGGRIRRGQDRARVTLSVPASSKAGTVPLRLDGVASVGGRDIVRPAVAAEDVMQAFAWRHLVPAHGFLACVLGQGGAALPLSLASEATLCIPVGGTAKIVVNAPPRGRRGRGQGAAPLALSFELDDPPAGITLEKATPVAAGVELWLRADAAAKPGMAGNLIVRVVATQTGAAPPAARQGGRRRLLGVLPALPLEIVAAQREGER